MKLWIIYKEGIGFSMLIAEMLQDQLEDYIDVSVGNAKKIDPAFLVEEKIDYLVIGDVISEEIPSLEIQNWLIKYQEISKRKKLILKAISGFYVALTSITVEPIWIKFLQDKARAEVIFPPLLRLEINKAKLVLKNGTYEVVKDYSNEFIEFLTKNK
ncbi:MAG: hypothetical protein ACW98D_02115 [Promethearchaeota archaeon]|jgi:menaquinone-dependent protoporphyrinogen IX oxidase